MKNVKINKEYIRLQREIIKELNLNIIAEGIK